MRRSLVNQLIEVVDGRLSLDTFELWLVGHLQPIIDSGDADLKAWADKLDGLLVQFGEQVVSEWELIEAFEDILRNLSTINEPSLANTERMSDSAANSVDIEMTIRELGAIQDLRPPVFVVG